MLSVGQVGAVAAVEDALVPVVGPVESSSHAVEDAVLVVASGALADVREPLDGQAGFACEVAGGEAEFLASAFYGLRHVGDGLFGHACIFLQMNSNAYPSFGNA